MLLLRSLALVTITLPLACGTSTEPDSTNASTEDDGADFNTIAQCESDTEFHYDYYTVSGSYEPGEPVDWNASAFRKVLQALSERRPGKYRIDVTYSRGLDIESATSILLLGDTGSAIHVTSSSFDDYHGGGGTSYWPAEECELQPASFFEACLANDESLKSCADPSEGAGPNSLTWLASCIPTEAVCR
ncbi:MAG: hypothetical protein H6716_17095 [Polyangiaceae bacterium]|nr:hypothetical protein [Polyangiaceae bacterium]